MQLLNSHDRPGMSMRNTFLVFILCLFSAGAPKDAYADNLFQSDLYQMRVATVARDLQHPWGMAFLPDGFFIVTEREGAIRIVSPRGDVSAPLGGLPKVAVDGQGGVLDVALDPDYLANKQIYVSFSEPGNGGAGTSVLRATLDLSRNTLRDVRVIFRQTPKTRTSRHFGSRLVFADDGTLFITTGDRAERNRVQDKSINRGQVIRINTDGSIPPDNPFANGGDGRPEVWSHGHRNPQGAALHPKTKKLWINEHGARGGDEINIPEAGKNYGWPIISYGRHYSGSKIGVGTAREGLEQPIYYWDPSIAPSGMAFYTADKFPKWKGNVFVGSLKSRFLSRLTVQGETVVAEERLLEGLDERVRDVRQGPDGYLYLLTDDYEGRLLRLEPAS